MGKNNKRIMAESDVGESEDASPSKRLNGTQNSQAHSQSVRFNNSDDEEVEDHLSATPKHSINYRKFQELLETIATSSGVQKKKANCNLEAFVDRNEWEDLSELQAAFRVYYKTASTLKHTPLSTAIGRVLDFMTDDAFVALHPDYPKPAAGSYQLLVKKLGGNIFSSGSEASKRLQDESDVLSNECKKEAELDKERFTNELKEFLKRHSAELLPEHLTSLQAKLRRLDKVKAKKEGGSAISLSSGKKKSKSKKLTAFDFYKLTKKHKYLDLSEQEREEKLRRHFVKLSDESRAIFEDLETNT